MSEVSERGLSLARGPAQPALLEQTIGANLEATIARHGDREALVSCPQGLRFTYTELGAEVDQLARGLIAAGVSVGDRLGIWSPNRAEWTLLQYATAKLGVILVNVNPAYRTSELEYVLHQSGCRMLIAALAFKTSDYRAMAAEVRADPPALESVIFLDSLEWEQLLKASRSVAPAELKRCGAALAPEDPINIQYTSGTTGFPKGATLTHRNILNNGYLVGRRAATPRPTASASRCPSTTASAWCWATSPAPLTARRWSSRRRPLTPRRPCRP